MPTPEDRPLRPEKPLPRPEGGLALPDPSLVPSPGERPGRWSSRGIRSRWGWRRGIKQGEVPGLVEDENVRAYRGCGG